MSKQKVFFVALGSFIIGALTVGLVVLFLIHIPPATITKTNSIATTTSDVYVAMKFRYAPLFKYTPADLVDKANSFIGDKVGTTYFGSNFILDIVKTEMINKQLKETGNSKYVVYYRYNGLKEVSADEATVWVEFNKRGAITFSWGIYDCVNDPSLCKFKITKKEAIQLALQAGMRNIAEINVTADPVGADSGESDGWRWELTSNYVNRKDAGCPIAQRIHINISTGKIFGPFGWAGGCD